MIGHSEKLSSLTTFQAYLVNDINDVNSLDLITSDFPENCSCLILTNPSSDYNDIETTKIKNYINNGGNILCLLNQFSNEFVNLQSILDLYGVSVSSGIVKDSSSSKSITGDERFIIPNISYHKITEYIISDGASMFIESSKLNLADESKLDELDVEANTIIESSESSYISDTNETGPFKLGIELSKTISSDDENKKVSKLIIYSSSKFAQDSATIQNQNVIPFKIYSNKDLLLNTVAYLSNNDSSITIRKNTNAVTYTATEEQNNIVLLIIFIFPIIIIIIGIVVSFIRKRRS